MLKWLKKWTVTILIAVVLFLSVGLILSFSGETRECEYLWKKDFALKEQDYSAAIYAFDNDGTNMYGLTIARVEKFEGEVLCHPAFLYLSGEKSVVSFGWGKLAVLILSVVMIFALILPRRKRVYEPEEETEDEPEEEEEPTEENENECPNCGEWIYEGLEYCENCGINIENFKKKTKKRNR